MNGGILTVHLHFAGGAGFSRQPFTALQCIGLMRCAMLRQTIVPSLLSGCTGFSQACTLVLMGLAAAASRNVALILLINGASIDLNSQG
jgi:hypothetical protein